MTDKPIEELVSSYDIPKREVERPINSSPYNPLQKLSNHSIDEEGKLIKEDGESMLTQQVEARKPDFENYTPPHHDPENYMTREEAAGSLKDRSFAKKAAGATLVGAGLAYGAKKGVDALNKARDLVEDARSYF